MKDAELAECERLRKGFLFAMKKHYEEEKQKRKDRVAAWVVCIAWVFFIVGIILVSYPTNKKMETNAFLPILSNRLDAAAVFTETAVVFTKDGKMYYYRYHPDSTLLENTPYIINVPNGGNWILEEGERPQ